MKGDLLIKLARFFFVYLLSISAAPLVAYQVDDNLVREYIDEIYRTVSATGYEEPDYDYFDDIVDAGIDEFEYNVDQQYDGHAYTNEVLTHFIDEGRRFRRYENSINCNHTSCFLEKYRIRHNHLSSCNICNGLSRMFLRFSPINPVAFYPEAAFYNGVRLRTARNGVFFRNQYCPMFFDTGSRGWFFDYGGRSYNLGFN